MVQIIVSVLMLLLGILIMYPLWFIYIDLIKDIFDRIKKKRS